MNTEPKIEVTEVDPGAAPLTRAAAEMSTALKFRLSVKKSRAAVIEAVKAARDIPLLDQDYILARIAAIPVEHDLLQLTVIGNPHKEGFNFTFTVCEV